ncbi:hypothetical protein NDU88_002967 [Pleurodeles waltl]|uniref:Uncharacterized protein n=1 Tax=Pleurodeles waltl TaxID=8319 RepID=A0AAV7VC32_PLEWA|nr:hypothetical protein NDU88_002967 [Pleurodeles waltl]
MLLWPPGFNKVGRRADALRCFPPVIKKCPSRLCNAASHITLALSGLRVCVLTARGADVLQKVTAHQRSRLELKKEKGEELRQCYHTYAEAYQQGTEMDMATARTPEKAPMVKVERVNEVQVQQTKKKMPLYAQTRQ